MALAPHAKVQQMYSRVLQSQQRSFISAPFLLIDLFTLCTPTLYIISIMSEVLFSQLTLEPLAVELCLEDSKLLRNAFSMDEWQLFGPSTPLPNI